MDTYEFLDSGNGRKLERFGEYVIVRPCSQAIWKPVLSKGAWASAHAEFTREPHNKWVMYRSMPSKWVIEIEGMRLVVNLTDFGHLGVFPEHASLWKWLKGAVRKDANVLNLFAYSGAATVAILQSGASACHLDSSKGMVTWARENVELNSLVTASVRWIIDDVQAFLKREIKRGRKYDGIILDPPTFGRGRKGEVFKIEEDLRFILEMCRELLSEKPLFIYLSCHTPGYTVLLLENLLSQAMLGMKGKVEGSELVLRGSSEVLPLPSGCYAKWVM